MNKLLVFLFLSFAISLSAQPTVDPSLKEGNSLLAQKKYQDAINVFDKIIKSSPKNADAYYSRGVAYSNLGNTIEAISDYTRANFFNPQKVEALINRGSTFSGMQKYDDALNDFNSAIKIHYNFNSLPRWVRLS